MQLNPYAGMYQLEPIADMLIVKRNQPDVIVYLKHGDGTDVLLMVAK